MTKSAHRFTKTDTALSLEELERNADGWLLEGECLFHSRSTLANRRRIVDQLLWFLRHRHFESCGTHELRLFFAYLIRGHEEADGRWGNPRMSRPVRPRTVHTYHGHLRTFFRWMVDQDLLPESPMEAIPAPIARADQIQPFTQDQIEALLMAARRSKYTRRDEALVTFLYDTGLRASELCTLRMRDLDIHNLHCTVLGKGNKHRTVPFSKPTSKILWHYLRQDPRDPDDPVFFSEKGGPLTRYGLLQLIQRLGKAAHIDATRCSPHTFRHTFAVQFLREGGHVFSLQQILGHTTLSMTNRYVALAQADIEKQHRQYSPVANLLKHSVKLGTRR